MPATLEHTPERKPTTSLPSASLERRCLSLSNTPALPSSTLRSATEPPEPLSINAILRQHRRTRLYVKPLHWTSLHLQLLGCRYDLQDPRPNCDAPSESHDTLISECQTTRKAKISTDTAIRAAKLILRTPSTNTKTLTTRELLEAHGICHYELINSTRPLTPGKFYTTFKLPFYFGLRAVANLHTDGVFSCSSTPSVPCLGYLDLESLSERRDKSFKPLFHRRSRWSPPVFSLQTKHQRRIRPPNELEDPYIAAVLIALAQFRRSQLPVGGTAETSDVHLLALPTDSRSLYFYTARIPLAFLDGLDHPSRHFPGGSFSIEYYRIPLTSKTELLGALEHALSAIHSGMPSRLPIGPEGGTELGTGNPATLNSASNLSLKADMRESKPVSGN